MLTNIYEFFTKLVKSPDIRRKIGVTAVVLMVFRLVAHVPAAGIDTNSLQELFSGSALLSLLDVFSGGTLANFSIMALGLTPYINASIILQLLTFVVPKLEELSKEGEYGQEKINQYTRIITVPFAGFQAFAMYTLLLNQGVIPGMSTPQLVALVITMVAGTMLAVWLGELISEYGVGNGISVLIFAGILARLPVVLGQTIATVQPEDLARIAGFLAFAVVIVALIVFMNEATRRIPINYSRRARNSTVASSYLPLRLNQAGVIPIIFAVSLVLLPQFMGQFLSASDNVKLAEIGNFLLTLFDPQNFFYTAFYFLLVVGFTYFYTAVVFNPEKIAENLQKSGGYIPGIRPGKQTEKYLAKVLNRITLIGALFLGFIAVLPSLLQNIIGLSNLAIGGTGILIVVSVVLEVTRDLEAQLVMRKYDSFIR